MTNGKPLTEEEIEKAFRMDEFRHRGLSNISNIALRRYKHAHQVHEYFLHYSSETLFCAFIFFSSSESLERARKKGFLHEIENFTYKELEKAGRGSRDQISVIFEYDTHDNVVKNYEGNYFDRLR